MSRHELREATAAAGLPPDEALDLVVAALQDRAARGELSPRTVAKALSLQERFTHHLAKGHQVHDIADVDRRQVLRFMTAPTLLDDGRRVAPSARTRDNRRWAISLFFSTLRDLGVVAADPTTGISVDRGTSAGSRPLTDDEEALGRKHAGRFSGDSRGPAAWALLRSGATTGEAGAVAARDIDREARTAQLAGGPRAARRVHLDEWSTQHLRARVEDLGVANSSRRALLYDGSRGAESRTSATSQVIARVLRRAGLADQPKVRPSSLTAWAGRRAFDEEGLFVARRLLGISSLDDTARVIGVDPDLEGPL